MDSVEASGAWRTAAPGTWGNIGVLGLLNLPVPPVALAAGVVATVASCWRRIPALVALVHNGDRAAAEGA